MLTRLCGVIMLIVAVAATGVASPSLAYSDPAPPGFVKKCSAVTGKCTFVAIAELDRNGKNSNENGTVPAKGAKRVCHFGGAAQACSHRQFGNWSNSQQCYLQREDPQPPLGDPRWQGHTTGSIWACVRELGYDQGEHLVSRWVWLPGEPDTVVIDPLTLVYRAIAAMQLAPPLVRSAPAVGQVGLVNMPVWLWVEKSENTWGPITRSVTVPGLSVTATARVKAVNWTMGDGKTIRCAGAGTAYDKSMGVKDSPDCGHRYKKTSRELPECKYPVTATAQWDITWQSTLGDTGQISMTQNAPTQLRIGEAVPVLVDPNDSAPAAPAKTAC